MASISNNRVVHRILNQRKDHGFALGIVFFCVWGCAAPVWATQTHGQPEGLYAHQMAHFFFIISMWTLEFWLRQRNLVKEPGWRYVQIAAVLFILWNINAMAVHFLDEQIQILQIEIVEKWRFHIAYAEGYRGLAILYYFLKLDHLLCVPAMLYLYLGLKRIILQAETTS
jgi:hypothetical protein